MELKMSEHSRAFLERFLPSVFQAKTSRDALLQLDDFIIETGFAPPHYDEYNTFGCVTQRVYDDLYLSNVKRE